MGVAEPARRHRITCAVGGPYPSRGHHRRAHVEHERRVGTRGKGRADRIRTEQATRATERSRQSLTTAIGHGHADRTGGSGAVRVVPGAAEVAAVTHHDRTDPEATGEV